MGYVGIVLSEPIFVTHVSIDHLPKCFSKNIETVPRDVVIWGILYGTEHETLMQAIPDAIARVNTTFSTKQPPLGNRTPDDTTLLQLRTLIEEHAACTLDENQLPVITQKYAAEILQKFYARQQLHGLPRALENMPLKLSAHDLLQLLQEVALVAEHVPTSFRSFEDSISRLESQGNYTEGWVGKLDKCVEEISETSASQLEALRALDSKGLIDQSECLATAADTTEAIQQDLADARGCLEKIGERVENLPDIKTFATQTTVSKTWGVR
ncbi:hypothetical protein OF83DRAFT_1088192 [Amylostereum chailletii]|nr:hypothetical protein OF83DRAFT_1088192 [Amylostereum chailletii]